MKAKYWLAFFVPPLGSFLFFFFFFLPGYHLLYFIFWPHHATCGILVSPSGIEPTPPALEAWHLTHWTTREVPCLLFSKGTPGLGEEDRIPSGWLCCFG